MSGRQPVADIYIRESNELLARGYSPAEMIDRCRALAASLGATVGREVVEVAKRDEFDRPELDELIRRAGAGESDYLLSYDMLRLSGDVGVHLWVKDEIGKTRCQIRYVEAEYPDTPEGELQEVIQGAVGRYERMKTRARTQNGIRGKLKKRQPIGNGKAPYGLEKLPDEHGKPIGYGPKDGEFVVVQRILRDLQTMPMGAICAALVDEGVPTPSGKGRWQPGTIYAIVNNLTYVGTYRYGQTKRTPARRPDGTRTYKSAPHDPSHLTSFAIAPSLSVVEVERAREAMRGRQRQRAPRGPEAEDPYLLRGVLTCGHCRGALSCTRNNGYRRYTCLRAYPPKALRGHPTYERCPGPLPQVHAEALERHVWEAIWTVLSDEEATALALAEAADGGEAVARHARQVAHLRGQIVGFERRIRNQIDILGDAEPGSTSHQYATQKRREAEQTKAILEANLEVLERAAPPRLAGSEVEALAVTLAQLRAGLVAGDGDPAVRRAILRAFGVRLEVGLDADGGGVRLGQVHRYRVDWRGGLNPSNGGKDLSQSMLLLSISPTGLRWSLGHSAPPAVTSR